MLLLDSIFNRTPLLFLRPALLQSPILPPALLGLARGLLPLHARDDTPPTLPAIEQVIDLPREDLARLGAVLRLRALSLALDDDAGGDVLQLDGRVCFVLGC